MRIHPAAIIVLSLLAAPADAQLTGKQATAQLRAASKQTLKDARSSFKDAKDAALDQIEAYEEALAANGFVQDDAIELFGDLDAFLGALQGSLRGACSDFTESALDLLLQVLPLRQPFGKSLFLHRRHFGIAFRGRKYPAALLVRNLIPVLRNWGENFLLLRGKLGPGGLFGCTLRRRLSALNGQRCER